MKLYCSSFYCIPLCGDYGRNIFVTMWSLVFILISFVVNDMKSTLRFDSYIHDAVRNSTIVSLIIYFIFKL